MVEKIIYRATLIDGDNVIAFDFSSYFKMTRFVETAFMNATRPANLSAVINQMRIKVEEVAVDE